MLYVLLVNRSWTRCVRSMKKAYPSKTTVTTPASPDVWGAYLVSVTKEFEGYDYEARKH